MHFKRLRELFIEGKIYFTRTYSYLNIINFLMIVVIFLNTTLWDYGPVQQIFSSRRTFLLTGMLIVFIFTILIGYFDTRYKLWRTESERGYMPDRNPLFSVLVFICAKMLNDMKRTKSDTKEIEPQLDQIFERCGLKKEFDKLKQETK